MGKENLTADHSWMTNENGSYQSLTIMNDIFQFIHSYFSLNLENMHITISFALVCVCKYHSLSFMYCKYNSPSFIHKKLPFMFVFNENKWDISRYIVHYHLLLLCSGNIIHFLQDLFFKEQDKNRQKSISLTLERLLV